MNVNETTVLKFGPASTRTGPAPHGQVAIWHVLATLGPEHGSYLNLYCDVVVSPDTTDDAVLSAITVLLLRHESLRSVYADRGAEGIEVTTLAEGEVDVLLVHTDDADVRPATNETTTRLRATNFDLTRDVPLRAAIIRSATGPARAVLVMPVIAVDGRSLELLTEEFQALLDPSSDPLPPASWQPIDEGQHERSDVGRRAHDRTLAHWRERLMRMPEVRTHHADACPPRFWNAYFTSVAVANAAHMVAARDRVAVSSVLMSVLAQALGRHDDATECVWFAVAGNRYHARLQRAIGHFSQTVPLAVDLSSDDLGRVMASAHAASLGAARYGSSDPLATRRLTDEVLKERGQQLELGRTFNFHRTDTPDAIPDLDALELNSMKVKSTLSWGDTANEENMTFYAHVYGTWPKADMTFWIDTTYISRSELAALVLGMEDTLVAFATGQPMPT
jgi:hypothetical protein